VVFLEAPIPATDSQKLAKFPGVFDGLFGRSIGPGLPSPLAFHGFFGLPDPAQDRPIVANF
jgi:hypothetical protein